MQSTEVPTPSSTEQPDRVYEFGVGVLRTAVPSGWGAAVGWLADHGVTLPGDARLAVQWVLVIAATAVWYAGWHRIEHLLPPWLTRLLLGSNTPPRYTGHGG